MLLVNHASLEVLVLFKDLYMKLLLLRLGSISQARCSRYLKQTSCVYHQGPASIKLLPQGFLSLQRFRSLPSFASLSPRSLVISTSGYQRADSPEAFMSCEVVSMSPPLNQHPALKPLLTHPPLALAVPDRLTEAFQIVHYLLMQAG